MDRFRIDTQVQDERNAEGYVKRHRMLFDTKTGKMIRWPYHEITQENLIEFLANIAFEVDIEYYG